MTLVAVSKTVPADRVRAAVAAGLDGARREPRPGGGRQDARDVDGATWHLIGPLQSNKARRAVELFDVVESVDTLELAGRLDRLAGELRPGRPLPVLLQVNVAATRPRRASRPTTVAAALPGSWPCPNLRVDGLMTIGALVASPEAARPTFRALRTLADGLRAARPGLGAELSMGMTDDYEVAVEEGATIVRVGRALFGERPHHDEGDHRHD